MKHVLSALLIIFCSGLLSAQNEVIDRHYPYRIISTPVNEQFPVGNHVFKTYSDYLKYMNPDPTKLMVTSAFFNFEETGVVLSRAFGSGSDNLTVDRVEETDYEVIIYTKVIIPKGRSNDMAYRNCFIGIKQTFKKVVIVETTE